MLTLVPNYYNDFECIADKCLHTCCQKWEIDIDESTKRLYDSLPGPCGEELKKSIRTNEEGIASFIFREDGYCPFLNKDGLCRLILTYGEEALCDICADHPRFRNFFGGQTEVGIGLCCEAAARLILSFKAKATLVIWDEDNRKRQNTKKEKALLAFRERLFQISQDRKLTIRERVSQICDIIGHPFSFDASDWVPKILSLERLDPIWDELMGAIRNETELPPCIDAPELSILFEQFLVYHLFRYTSFENSEQDVNLNIAFCVLMLSLYASLIQKHALTPELNLGKAEDIARIYSSEIEYSDENVGLLIHMISKIKTKE